MRIPTGPVRRGLGRAGMSQGRHTFGRARPMDRSRGPAPNSSAPRAKTPAPRLLKDARAGRAVESPEGPVAVPAPGRPLDPETRRGLEAALGHDFSRIRIHDDGRAGEATRGLGARAFAA